jgi:hypothetical protein
MDVGKKNLNLKSWIECELILNYRLSSIYYIAWILFKGLLILEPNFFVNMVWVCCHLGDFSLNCGFESNLFYIIKHTCKQTIIDLILKLCFVFYFCDLWNMAFSLFVLDAILNLVEWFLVVPQWVQLNLIFASTLEVLGGGKWIRCSQL